MWPALAIVRRKQAHRSVLVLPAPSVVDLAKASEVVGEQVRLASESEFTTAFSNCEAGAMPPFGNLYDLPVYVDLALGQNERIVFQAGTHSVTMSVAYDEFERLAAAAVADLAVVCSARPSAQRLRIGQVRVRETPSTAWMLETTIRPSSSRLSVSTRATTSYGPVTT